MDYVDVQFEDRGGVWVTVSNVIHDLQRLGLRAAVDCVSISRSKGEGSGQEWSADRSAMMAMPVGGNARSPSGQLGIDPAWAKKSVGMYCKNINRRMVENAGRGACLHRRGRS